MPKPLGRGLLPLANGLTVEVRIWERKVFYGVARYRVTPVTGTGEAWCNEDSLTLKPKKEKGE